MSGDIGSTNISFSDIVTAYNNIYTTSLPTTNISLSIFRNTTFTDSSSVPSTGAISIDTNFKGKTWQGDAAAPTLSITTTTYWSTPTGSGTSASPYAANSTNGGINNSTARLIFSVSGNGFVTISSTVDSERNYDWGHVIVNGTQVWRDAGSNKSFGPTQYSVSNGDTIEFKYTKDISVSSYSDRQTMQIYTST